MGMYPEYMVAPIREDLTSAGFEQLMTPEEVESVLGSKEGTVLMAINSVCGCAASKGVGDRHSHEVVLGTNR